MHTPILINLVVVREVCMPTLGEPQMMIAVRIMTIGLFDKEKSVRRQLTVKASCEANGVMGTKF